ncbi:MAG: cytochrome c [Verrucomicrobiota bacterium]
MPIRLIAIVLISAAAPTVAPGQQATDVVVSDHTLVQRGNLPGPSTRMIAVGFPEGFNYAFDAVHCTPVYTWSGDFIDFKGELAGRGGGKLKILGNQQALALDTIPLRINNPDSTPTTIRFKGYRRNPNDGSPTFLSEIDGVPVEQSLSSTGPNKVALNLAFPSKSPDTKYVLIDPTPHAQVKLGKNLRWSGPGIVEIPGNLPSASIIIHLKSSNKEFVREIEKLTGEEVFKNFCSACHSVDGTKLIGPTFKNLWGREQTITRNGITETIKINENYVRESISNPQAAIAKGYETVPMADFSAMLTKEQIDSLIDYLQKLK